MKITKIVPVKWIPDNFDSDWDGVPNYKDCEPFNPHKQDDNVMIAKKYLKKAISTKSKKPLKELNKFMKTLSIKEKEKIIVNHDVKKLVYYIDRKLLPEIDPSHVPFGPY